MEQCVFPNDFGVATLLRKFSTKLAKQYFEKRSFPAPGLHFPPKYIRLPWTGSPQKTDSLENIYRLQISESICLHKPVHFQALAVYGPAMKELIHEEFGDGIMSAIDFTVDVQREENANGDRVKMTWSGKFLPYKPF